MRREIKLIILVFVLVVGPAIALSFFAARVLESWQIVLQKRMAGEAGHVLNEAVVAWDRELTALREKSGSLPPKPTSAWVVYAAGLSLQHPWLEGLFVFQTGAGLLYPAIEPASTKFERSGSTPELENVLNQGGACLEKGDTNSALECFEKVGGRSGQWAVGNGRDQREDITQRDPEEGFFYDLIALKKLAELIERRGQAARAAEIRLSALERVLSRYDDLVPLQRDSLVEWLGIKGLEEPTPHPSKEGSMRKERPEEFPSSEGLGVGSSGLQAQWRERMRGRGLGQEERTGVVSGIAMMESTVPDAGWITMRLRQARFLVTKIPQPAAAPLVLALQFNERSLTGYLDALFARAASNTQIRVRCQESDEENTGLVLATRQLSAPFDAISLVAIPGDAPAFLANARLQTRLYRGGGLLLLISVVAGGWLVWREAAMEIRQARERSDFAAVVSHDLRTPLSSMRMLAESLYMGNVTDEAKRHKFLGAIIKESDRLSRLTDRALYFIRYGQGALRYQFTEGDLGGVVREAVRVNGEWLRVNGEGKKGQAIIKVNIAPDLPPVKFDAGAMEQVVYNLLDNAVKYSSLQDGVVQIEVGLVAEARKIVLSVKDHGVGMTPAEVRHVLKPYVRGRTAGRQNARGIGLGLALCQHVVQAHGGHIQIQSEPGKGTKFEVVLPV